jgi:hypothetical protein
MSKNTQHPIILKKEDSNQQKSRSVPTQPKILTKAPQPAKENVPTQPTTIQQPPKKDPEVPLEVPEMRSCHRFMYPHFNIEQKTFDYLDNENTDFLVVAAIGVKNVGKSTLMNIVADQKYVTVNPDGSYNAFQKNHEIFTTKVSQNYEGSSLDLFITTDRVFIFDPSPLSTNVQRRDMIVAESDDLKMLIMLLQVCHLLVIVHNGFPDVSLMRLLHLADLMIPADVKHRAHFIYVGNNMQPGTKVMKIDEKLSTGCNLMIPNLHHPSVRLYHDVEQVIQDYQEQIFMLKRYSMLNDDEEVFTEKKWSQRVIQVMEGLKGDYFLRKYDTLREKYHQAVEGS